MNKTASVLSPATPDDIPLLQTIAYNTWPVTFRKILSKEQIVYMLERMYNKQTLTELMYNPNFLFYLINKNAGLAAIEFHFEGSTDTKLHKIYILPEYHGKGLGSQVIRELETISRSSGDLGLILNVNKNNPATHFYEKCGFTRSKSEVIDIGQGYVMDDYVYRKRY